MKKKDFLRLLGKEEPFFVVEGKNPNYATNSCSFMTRMYIHGELERKVRFDLVLASPYSWCRILSGSSYGKCFKTILLKYNRGRWDKYDVVCTIFPKREDYEGYIGLLTFEDEIKETYDYYENYIACEGYVNDSFLESDDECCNAFISHFKTIISSHNTLVFEKDLSRWKAASDAANGIKCIPENTGLDDLLNKLGMPNVVNNVRVQIESKSYYNPSEYQIRFIQVIIKNNPDLKNSIRIFDKNEKGEEYEMEFNTKGKFKNKFVSNFYKLNNKFIFEIL